jgi:hypothetical protein
MWTPDLEVVIPPIKHDNPIYPVVMKALDLYPYLSQSIYISIANAAKMTQETAPLFLDSIDHVEIAVRNYYLGWDQEVYIPEPNYEP